MSDAPFGKEKVRSLKVVIFTVYRHWWEFFGRGIFKLKFIFNQYIKVKNPYVLME